MLISCFDTVKLLDFSRCSALTFRPCVRSRFRRLKGCLPARAGKRLGPGNLEVWGSPPEPVEGGPPRHSVGDP